MKSLRTLLVTLMSALTLAACGSGSVQSPDFTPVLKTLSIDNAPGSSTPVGRALQLSSTGGYSTPPGSDTPTSARPASPRYTLDDASVARIDGSTLIGLKVGTVNVTATQDGVTSAPVAIGVTAAVLDQIVLSPADPTIPLGSSVDFTARGIYSDDPAPRDIDPADQPLTWASSDTDVATVAPIVGQPTTKQRATSTLPASASPTATITASTVNALNEPVAGSTVLTVGPAVFNVVTDVLPDAPSVALGRSQAFTANGTRTDGTTGAIPNAQLTWTSATTTVADIDANGLATTLGKMQGSSVITAALVAYPSSANETLTVTPPVLETILVTPQGPSVAVGASVSLTAQGIYSDSATPRDIVTPVSWATNPAVTTTLVITPPATGKTISATGGLPTGNVVVTASSTNEESVVKSGDATVTVTNPVLLGMTSVAPANATVPKGFKTQYTAYGNFGDGSTQPISNSYLDWTSDAVSVATIDTNGIATGLNPGQAVITAALKDSEFQSASPRSATAVLTVSASPCSTPFLASLGATVRPETSGLLCLLCRVDNAGNVIDAAPDNAATIQMPVSLLNGSAGVLVQAGSGPGAPGGSPAGFIIRRPAGMLASAEILSQLTISTLIGNTVLESSSEPTTPLRITLLGMAGTQDSALISFPTTMAFDGLRLSFNSGVASALTSLEVSAACAVASPSP